MLGAGRVAPAMLGRWGTRATLSCALLLTGIGMAAVTTGMSAGGSYWTSTRGHLPSRELCAAGDRSAPGKAAAGRPNSQSASFKGRPPDQTTSVIKWYLAVSLRTLRKT
jgi:hypothetical protein